MSKITPDAANSVGKYGALIQKAKSPGAADETQAEIPENQNSGLPENQKTRKPESANANTENEEVNLSIKVPRVLRQHWASEAKRQGTSLTAAITAALKEKFGEP